VIIDSSAIIAILREEPETEAFIDALLAASSLSMSTATLTEVFVVLAKAPLEQVEQAESLINDHHIALVELTANQARAAGSAYRRFGKGSGHPAKLNFGDCFAYALAKESGERLLFKGNDFSQTDILPALG
jgi:ribonuclease VapC